MSIAEKHFPTFSIITITLNNYSGLQKTWKSIENQSYTNFEWLVVDGESSDATVEFLRERRSSTRSTKNPIRFISQKDDGIYDAMNSGIDMAKGHYLLFLNAGDMLANDKILERITPHTEKKPQFIYGDAYEQRKNGGKPIAKPARRYKEMAWGMFTHHQAMLYRRHTIRDFKLRYSLLYKISADYGFTARFLLKAKKIIYIQRPICIFELGGISQKKAALGRKEQYIIRETLDIIPVYKNLWILIVQTISWNLNTYAPWLYIVLKPLVLALTSSKKTE